MIKKELRSRGAKPESWSDERLISEIIAGNTALFEIITKRYNQRLFRILRGYLTDQNDAKDVMQSAYLKAFEGLAGFRGEAQFSTWLIRIAINEALKKLKREKDISVSDPVTIRRQSDQKYDEEKVTPETKAIRSDMNRHLEKAIDRLPPKYRSVLIMRELEQMSTEETAESLNISRANVKVRLHRAKKMLRNELEQVLDKMDLYSFRGENCELMTRKVMNKITIPTEE